jgi:exodeoxyribonuclease V alpha subunit
VSALAEPFDAARALDAPEPLRGFNDIGVLSAADVHVAMALCDLAGVVAGPVRLAVALAVRAPRLGHVFVDLETVRDTAAVESDEVVDLSALPWPLADEWVSAVGGCDGLVAVGEEQARRPLRLLGSRLYLDRYWCEERQVAADLLADAQPPVIDESVLRNGIERLFAGRDDAGQRRAAEAALRRRLSVIAGGPGTGKTTTVARIVALLYEQAAAAGRPAPLIALTAFTGKASARMEELVREEAARLPVDETVRSAMLDLRASTIHGLLGRRLGSHTKFRHDRLNALPHDVVIVDETSMVSLWLMARLLEAARPDARVMLVGDPGQLTAIEAGAVLRDIVGPVGESSGGTSGGGGFGAGIVVLERVHRFGEPIAAVAAAIRRGDGEGTGDALRAGAGAGVEWIEADAAGGGPIVDPVRTGAVASGSAVVGAALAGDATGALRALGSFRVLCAHRRGPHGVATWTGEIERWLSSELDGFDVGERDYVGRPLLITANDHELRLSNGDTGVIVLDPAGRMVAAFENGRFAPTRLAAVETVYAMTIHKSQGSQFDTAAVLLPDPSSRILTRELLYTAVTRARQRLLVIGTEEMVRAAVERPVARATGLRERLWGD